ncbi:MAG: glycosyltransferase [Burkholderiaceae bacterium]
MPDALVIPSGIHLIKLPILLMSDTGTLETQRKGESVESAKFHRRKLIRKIVLSLQPDILIIEMFPFGRKQFADEIIDLINIANAHLSMAGHDRSRTTVVASIRDILVSRPNNQNIFDQRAVTWLNQYFDALLIHSDPDLISLAETFTAYSQIEIPIHYTGFVSSSSRNKPNKRELLAVVSAGGGRVGEALVRTAMKAATQLKEVLGLRTIIIAGPNSAISDFHSSGSYELVQFVDDFASLLTQATLSISQCGYNTATDVLASDVAAVFVPYETPKEDEQQRRADLLSARNRAICIRPGELTSERLVAAARQALELPSSMAVNLNGVTNTVQILEHYYGR